jgi:hypothetical protein
VGDHGTVHPPTFAAGVRLPFAELPVAVRDWIAHALGGDITDAVDKVGGFSPGVAAVVTTNRGARGFVKAVGSSINTESVVFHRAENAVMARLPRVDSILRPVASESLQVDGDDWEVMILPVIDGDTPRHPWSDRDVARVLDALVELGNQFTPSPWPRDEKRERKLAGFFRGWTRIQDDTTLPWASHPWVAAHLAELVAVEPVLHDRLRGDTLSHCDLRADNVLLTGDAVWFVDWAHAGNAARWVDPVLLLGDVVASGAGTDDGGEVDIERLMMTHKAFAGVDEWTVGATLVTLAATLHWLSRQSPPPGLPTIREFQHLQAEALLRHIARRHPGGLPSPV